MKERQRQRLVKAVLQASEYTDLVDRGDITEGKRTRTILKELYTHYLGIYVGDSNLPDGVVMCQEQDISEAENCVQTVFELFRRYKTMNPELLRYEYAKALSILQDSSRPHVSEHLGFSAVTPIKTVKSEAIAMGIPDLLEDEDLALATTPVPRLRYISDLNKALRRKDLTVKSMVYDYSMPQRVGNGNTKERVEQLIRSIDDCNCYLRDNCDTIVELLELLEEKFSPDNIEADLALSIAEGTDGSRLSHDHAQQYQYVLQSLTLWKNITANMYKLWLTMETDLLDSECDYTLSNTGQGFHRLQQSKRLYSAMDDIIRTTKEQVEVWIGSDKVHMGDNQVPNGFLFIDKYTQISRIINPILCTLDEVDTIAKDKEQLEFIQSLWSSPDKLKKVILCDFFKHAFDGSGGSNDLDAGSCIDGRLTSAWNWCSTIKKKSFYPIFLLAGFASFDGELDE
eukprot:TRINITY_DN1661_c2_g1_i1.p2 TRINITY_DN1661_c2_g1~~TRINITY_DN1661_c2_g1_i1.p2  ORF type:complete len:455 (+),score=61.36 TRINITY_DN1661_c2_g1_i1:218-1582(+)